MFIHREDCMISCRKSWTCDWYCKAAQWTTGKVELVFRKDVSRFEMSSKVRLRLSLIIVLIVQLVVWMMPFDLTDYINIVMIVILLRRRKCRGSI